MFHSTFAPLANTPDHFHRYTFLINNRNCPPSRQAATLKFYLIGDTTSVCRAIYRDARNDALESENNEILVITGELHNSLADFVMKGQN